MSESISYSAVVLDEISHQKLILNFKDQIPDGWDVIAHHMTITMGPLKSPTGKYDMSVKYPREQTFDLKVVQIGCDERAMAVKIELLPGYHTRNRYPHITLAVNREGGGKPWHSNQIDPDRFVDVAPLLLSGVVQEVPQKSSKAVDTKER